MSTKSWIIGGVLLAGSLVYCFLLPDSAESTAELNAFVAKQRRLEAIDDDSGRVRRSAIDVARATGFGGCRRDA